MLRTTVVAGVVCVVVEIRWWLSKPPVLTADVPKSQEGGGASLACGKKKGDQRDRDGAHNYDWHDTNSLGYGVGADGVGRTTSEVRSTEPCSSYDCVYQNNHSDQLPAIQLSTRASFKHLNGTI